MPDFNDKFRCSSDPDPASIIKLQAIAISHRNRLWKIKQYIVALIITAEVSGGGVARQSPE